MNNFILVYQFSCALGFHSPSLFIYTHNLISDLAFESTEHCYVNLLPYVLENRDNILL